MKSLWISGLTLLASLQVHAHSLGAAPWRVFYFETADAEKVRIQADDHSIKILQVRFPGCTATYADIAKPGDVSGVLDLGRTELLQGGDQDGRERILTILWLEQSLEGGRNPERTKALYFRDCKLIKTEDG